MCSESLQSRGERGPEVLDSDNSGRLSWGEFQQAGAKLGFPKERLPGVWSALDDDMSGWISLYEIHKPSYNVPAATWGPAATWAGALWSRGWRVPGCSEAEREVV